MKDKIIGFLHKGITVYCEDCVVDIDSLSYVPVYLSNIHPYKQNCAKCGKVLYKGASRDWPELFDKKG